MAENKFEEWLASMMKGGQARPNRFECNINFPAAIKANMVSQLPRDFTFRINSVSFPGKNIRTTTDENIYGPSYEVAQGLTYGEEISIEFYLRNTHEERWVFNSWQDYIVAPDSYNVEYYRNYVADIEVYQLDEQNNRTAGIKIKNCFPKTLNAIEMSNETASALLKHTVGFSFKEWIPLQAQGDIASGKATWVEYPEYKEKVVTRRGAPSLGFGVGTPNSTRFPNTSRPVGAAFNDKFPGREKGIFEDAGKAFNDVLAARDKVVFAQQKVLAFRNFFKGITKNPISNLGIGRGLRF
jgi:hypothetical protein